VVDAFATNQRELVRRCQGNTSAVSVVLETCGLAWVHEGHQLENELRFACQVLDHVWTAPQPPQVAFTLRKRTDADGLQTFEFFAAADGDARHANLNGAISARCLVPQAGLLKLYKLKQVAQYHRDAVDRAQQLRLTAEESAQVILCGESGGQKCRACYDAFLREHVDAFIA
jgi:hypothetical protein